MDPFFITDVPFYDLALIFFYGDLVSSEFCCNSSVLDSKALAVPSAGAISLGLVSSFTVVGVLELSPKEPRANCPA